MARCDTTHYACDCQRERMWRLEEVARAAQALLDEVFIMPLADGSDSVQLHPAERALREALDQVS